MLQPRCPRRRSLSVLVTLTAVSLLGLWLCREAPAQTTKRPLNASDYDSWNTIQGTQLSPNGQFVAYTLTPQEGEMWLVVRHVESGKEVRHSRGWKTGGGPAIAKGAAPGEGAPAVGKVAFTADSKRLIFTIAPGKAEMAAGKKGGETPKGSMGILDLSTGKFAVVPGVRSFQVAEESAGLAVVYHKSPASEPKAIKEDVPPVKEEDFQFQPGKGGGKKGGQAAAARQVPSDLVVRNFATASEFVIADVVEYTWSRDSELLVCAIVAKEPADCGVFAFFPDKKMPGKIGKQLVAEGKARYTRFTWDERQRFLAFFAEPMTDSKEPAGLSLMLADRAGQIVDPARRPGGPIAIELANNKTPFKEGMVLSSRGAPSFADDGSHVFFGVAPPVDKDTSKETTKDAAKDKAVLELWHWNDDFVQPMQKVRFEAEKNRTYRAVINLASKDRKATQLADRTLSEVIPSPDGRWALGFDDHPYRRLVAYDTSYSDWFLIDANTGMRKPLVKKHHWGITWSPHGRYVVFFDGKDWNSISVPDGVVTNLTKSLGLKLYSEDHDTPDAPKSYGLAGWTPDEYFVFIYDKYDIWKVSAKGSGHENLTRGTGRAEKVQLRYVKLDPKEKSIDLGAPVLLRAENLYNRTSGFFRLDPKGGPPLAMVMLSKNFGTPQMSKNGDVFVMPISTFYEFPDLYATRGDFKTFTRLSDANPQKANLLWGKAELIHYRSVDGVPLSGVLIKPDNFDPKKKYPMIVYIYEKLSQNVNHFVNPQPGTSINPSYYASNGYLVLMPDIVYTVGYPGQSALKCVMPALEAVALKGYLDEQAIGIQGHSWGGYETAYLITQTTRFKAAAAGAPVTNMTSAYGGIRWGTGLPRQFQYEKTQSRIGGTLWEFPLRYIENSPLFMADRIKTPLMILHNDQDDAVPWYQGVEFYLALRRLGKEVYLFNYPGEKHGLTKRVDQLDYTMRMAEFFDYHLRGGPMPGWMMNGLPYTPPPVAPKGATPPPVVD